MPRASETRSTPTPLVRRQPECPHDVARPCSDPDPSGKCRASYRFRTAAEMAAVHLSIFMESCPPPASMETSPSLGPRGELCPVCETAHWSPASATVTRGYRSKAPGTMPLATARYTASAVRVSGTKGPPMKPGCFSHFERTGAALAVCATARLLHAPIASANSRISASLTPARTAARRTPGGLPPAPVSSASVR